MAEVAGSIARHDHLHPNVCRGLHHQRIERAILVFPCGRSSSISLCDFLFLGAIALSVIVARPDRRLGKGAGAEQQYGHQQQRVTE
jgi:hypothetical protein